MCPDRRCRTDGWGREVGVHILVQGVQRVPGRISCISHSKASGKMKLPSTHGDRQSVETGNIPGSLIL